MLPPTPWVTRPTTPSRPAQIHPGLAAGPRSTPRFARADITDRIDRHDMIDRALPAEATEAIEANDPIDPMDRNDPTEPIESTDPFDPMDRNEFSDQRDNDERRVRSATAMGQSISAAADSASRPARSSSWVGQPKPSRK